MKKLVFVLLAIISCSLLIPSCGSSTPTAATPVLRLEIKSAVGTKWDSKTGLEFYILPIDRQGKLVAVAGTVEAKLFLTPLYAPAVREEQVQQWSNLKVSASDFDAVKGARLQVEYRNYQPTVVQHGLLDVTLQTKDGKKFTASVQDVVLRQ